MTTQNTNFAATLALTATTDRLTDETRKMLPELKGGASFNQATENIAIEIPTFHRSTKAVNGKIDTKNLVLKHSVTFDLPSYDVDTVRYFSLALQGLMIQPDWTGSLGDQHNANCKLTELVDYVIPTLRGLVVVKQESTNGSKDYPAICNTMNIGFVTAFAPAYDQHANDNSAITISIKKSQRADFETYLYATGAKTPNVFTYTSYNVVRSTILDDAQEEIIGYKYRFTAKA